MLNFNSITPERKEVWRLIAKDPIDIRENFVIEETSELVKELMKCRRGQDRKEFILEEAVDCLIVIYALLMHYEFEDYRINEKIESKLERAARYELEQREKCKVLIDGSREKNVKDLTDEIAILRKAISSEKGE